MELAERRVRGVRPVRRIGDASREPNLTGIAAQMRGALDENHAVRRIGEDRQDDGRLHV
jgi:hypothetical protein